MLRVWGRPTSTCTERVLWALAEAAVPFDLTLASATMGPNGPVGLGHAPFGIVDTAEYRARNPNGTVPTIDDDGFVLWDSLAILAYIASKAGSLHLADPRQLATAIQWMSWTNEHLDPPLHTLVMHLVRLPATARDRSVVEAARQLMLRPLGLLDAHLGRNDYICGARFTIGDIPAGVGYHRWLMFDLEAPGFANLTAWHARLMDRDGFRRHVAPAEFHVTV